MHPLLEATDRIAVATGIVNVWQYEPELLAAEYTELARAYFVPVEHTRTARERLGPGAHCARALD